MARRIRKDTRKLDKLLTQLEILEQLSVTLSFDASKNHPRSGTSAIDVARINYYGSQVTPGRPPARPFFDEAYARAELEVNSILAKGYGQVLRGEKSARQVMRLVANAQKRHLMYVLRNGHSFFVPNAPNTVRNKGFDAPLRETGTFLTSAIQAKVHDR